MTILGSSYLARFDRPLAAYNQLQAALLRRVVARGGTIDQWIDRIAPVFRSRHGWLCERRQPVPVPVRVRRDSRYR